MGRLTSAQKAEVVVRYLAGESSPSLAAHYGIAQQNIRGILHRRRVAVRDRREAHTRHALRHDAFEVIDAESAYWLGFLFADGTVSRRPGQTPEVAVVLSDRDRGHVEKLRAFLGSTHAITVIAAGQTGGYTSRPKSRFSVRSSQLAERVLSLGRYNGPLAAELAISRHFWRGVVDGDGSLALYQGPLKGALAASFRLVGERWLLEDFRSFLVLNGLAAKLSVRPFKSICIIGTTCGPAGQIVDLLYCDTSTALDRKMQTAAAIHRNAARTIREPQERNDEKEADRD